MPITNLHRRYAFVHIPKTGGSSIAVLMGAMTNEYRPHELTGMEEGRQLTHLSASEMLARVGRDNRYWFAIVRNPWDRAVSEYAYRKLQCSFPYLPGSIPTFPEFIRFITQPNLPVIDDIHGGRHLVRQVDYLYDGKGRLLVDRIFNFDYLSDIGPTLFERPTPHVNAAPHEPWWTWYDESTEQLVGDYFRDDTLISHAIRPSQMKERV